MSRINTRRVNKAEVKQRRKKTLKKSLRISAVGLALLLSITTLVVLNQAFRVDSWDIEVVGSGHGELKQQVDTAMRGLEAYDFWSTRPSALRSRLLKAVPDLQSIEIRRSMAGSLYLRAKARTPIGLWKDGSDGIYLVDMRGEVYRKLATGETADLPILRIGSADVAEAAQLLQTVHAGQPALYPQISELFAGNDSWKINFSRGEQWLISRQRNTAYAVNKIGDLLRKPRWRQNRWRIDARSEKRWFIRPTGQEGVI